MPVGRCILPDVQPVLGSACSTIMVPSPRKPLRIAAAATDVGGGRTIWMLRTMDERWL